MLTNKNSSDEEGWRNEMIKYGGEEMHKSLCLMINQLQVQGIPKQWQKMKIKSIYKGKGSRKEVGNRRGLFLSSILSKVVEKILLRRVEKQMEIRKYQTGGKKGTSTVDSWMVLMAILDNNRRKNQKTYILMADAEKCFDRLWLQDCLVDLKNAGLREKEVSLLYQMNEYAQIVVESPSGTKETITVNNIVKQGTVFGPIMCCVNSQKVNNMEEKNITLISPSLHVEAMSYVDDIMGAGRQEQIEVLGRNLRQMEIKKKYTFNNANGKSHYMIIKTGNDQEEDVEILVGKGKITRASEYKYLGNWIDERGTVERQISEVENKS